MYEYKYIYILIHICIHIYTFTNMYTYTYTYTYIYVCIYICTYKHIYTYTCIWRRCGVHSSCICKLLSLVISQLLGSTGLTRWYSLHCTKVYTYLVSKIEVPTTRYCLLPSSSKYSQRRPQRRFPVHTDHSSLTFHNKLRHAFHTHVLNPSSRLFLVLCRDSQLETRSW